MLRALRWSPSRRRTAGALAAVALLAGVVAAASATGGDPPVRTEPVSVQVPEGPDGDERITLDATLHLPERTPAPAVLLAHGFGGSKDSVAADADELARRGLAVLAYSARGFGASGGLIGLNAPDREVADASRLLDWLADRDDVVRDADGDPRVGVVGGSYGGALALLLAGTDARVDAVVPSITWNALDVALFPNAASPDGVARDTPAPLVGAPDGVFKREWAGIFFGAGLAPGRGPVGPVGPVGETAEEGGDGTGGDGGDGGDGDGTGGVGGDGAAAAPTATPGSADGAAPPLPDGTGAACGRFRPEVCAAYARAATTGRPDDELVELLRRSSPASVAGRITAPTLLVQGERDTLFGLDQADATARQIAAAGGPVSVVWYAGGHDGGAPGPRLRDRIGAFLDEQLAGTAAGPSPGFSYQVQSTFGTAGFAQRTVEAPAYPGLDGDPVRREVVALRGDEQLVVRPPGGSPASVSGLPGLGAALGAATDAGVGVAADLPGQAAAFASEPLPDPVEVAGGPTVRLAVTAVPSAGAPAPSDAVLFVKLYDVAPDGRRTLPGAAVAPVRVALPADGSPAEVDVALAGVVRPVEAGHRLELAVATTDRSYAVPAEPAAFRVRLVAPELTVPVVPGQQAAAPLPVRPLLGLAGLGAVLLAVAGAAALRRRRIDDADPALAEVPLVVRNLAKRWPSGLTAVEDLSFRVERGEVLGLLGPNGAGKTTTLRMLLGLIRPSAGEIRVFGARVGPGAPVLSRTGSFVEGSGFLPHLSGADNLRLYWAATGRPPGDARLDDALEIAGLGSAVDRRVGTYSQGMRQRLAIAQAMLGLPDLLVLDEPTNGLDPPQIHAMREVLRGYAARGRTVLVSSHLLAEVEQTCTAVVVMHRGRLVAAGTVADIVAGGGGATFAVDDPARAAEVLRGLDGVGAVEVAGEADGGAVHAELGGLPRSVAVSALVRAGVAVTSAGPRRRLEDAFLQLVGADGDAPAPGAAR